MLSLRALCLATTVAAFAAAATRPAHAQAFASEPERVTIDGFIGEAQNPFISRDGRYLFFNNRNDAPERTNIVVAVRIDARTFRSLGPLVGANSPSLDSTPSMDRMGRFIFVSMRSYERTLHSVFAGVFENDEVRAVRPVQGVAAPERGRIIFDAEISADGGSLYYVDGRFIFGQTLPWEADIMIARRYGQRFARDRRYERLFENVNTGALEYAPSTSADERELFFTRAPRPPAPFSRPQIWRATRGDPSVPFNEPERLPLEGHVEAPSVAPDGSIYFHRRDDGRFRLYRLPRAR